jgi:hypothetical protein
MIRQIEKNVRIKRAMSLDTKKGKEIGGSSKAHRRLTIMIFRKTGKVMKFGISSRLMLGASVFFIFYIIATIFMINEYLEMYRVNRIQAKDIAELSSELVKTTESLERAEQRIALSDEYIKEEKRQSSETISTGGSPEPSLPKLVSIEELTAGRDGSRIHVTFKVLNEQPDEGPVGGYIFVLASTNDQSEVWVYPSSPIKEGLPVDHTRGHRFFIKNFMPISTTLNLSKSIDELLTLEILVYDRDGELVLQKAAEV